MVVREGRATPLAATPTSSLSSPNRRKQTALKQRAYASDSADQTRSSSERMRAIAPTKIHGAKRDDPHPLHQPHVARPRGPLDAGGGGRPLRNRRPAVRRPQSARL